MTVLSKMMDPTLDDLLASDDEGDDFDELNYDGTSDEEEDDSMFGDEANEDDDDDESDDDDDEEFLFDDVKQSIEYIQERYNFFKRDKVKSCSIYSIYLSPKDSETGLQSWPRTQRLMNLVDGLLPKHTLMSFLKEETNWRCGWTCNHKMIHISRRAWPTYQFVWPWRRTTWHQWYDGTNNKLSDIQFQDTLSILINTIVFLYFYPW